MMYSEDQLRTLWKNYVWDALGAGMVIDAAEKYATDKVESIRARQAKEKKTK